MLTLCPPSQRFAVDNLDRFNEEFGDEGEDADPKQLPSSQREGAQKTDEQDSIATAEASDLAKGREIRPSVLKGGTDKPLDHRLLFDGNCDDHFRIGMLFNECMQQSRTSEEPRRSSLFRVVSLVFCCSTRDQIDSESCTAI